MRDTGFIRVVVNVITCNFCCHCNIIVILLTMYGAVISLIHASGACEPLASYGCMVMINFITYTVLLCKCE